METKNTQIPCERQIKVSVITLHTAINYGSVLQTYATSCIFRKHNCSVEFVDYTRENITAQAYADRMQNRTPIRIFKKVTLGLFNKPVNKAALKRVNQRMKPFRKFVTDHVTLTENAYSSFDELLRNPPIADVYCTGSDQVWNSVWNDGLELPYFLEYAPEGKRRIAYAASIGRSDVDDAEMEGMLPYLKKYTCISMRESTGVELLEKHGVSAQLVLDPTLMLCHDEWMKVAEPIKPREKGILLAYVLNWNETIDACAKKIASEKGLEIIRICKSSISRRAASGTTVVVVESVGQILSYFDAADCVITDSFHATAFSVNFHKNFVVVPPKRFSTRLESFLSLVGLESRKLDGTDTSVIDEPIDWDGVDMIIEQERVKSEDYLTRALEGVKAE